MLIGVEWASNAFRASLISPRGEVVETVVSDTGTTAVRDRNFAETFFGIVPKIWFPRTSGIYLAGMATGRGGWVETPFAPAPAALADLAEGAKTLRHHDVDLTFLPGISASGALPDMMRGEELKVLAAARNDDATIVILPGQHTKCVGVSDGRLTSIATYMGGETARLLCRDSLVGRLIPADCPLDQSGFDMGLQAAWNGDIPGGPLRRLFSARSLVLSGRLGAQSISGYITGLMIGAEIAEMDDEWGLSGRTVIVLGEGLEAKRYHEALQQRTIKARLEQASSALSFAALHQILFRPAQSA